MNDNTAEIIELTAGQAKKDLYEVGEIPPLGHVPKQMYAWAIRRERHAEPKDAMQVEVVDTPELDSHDVLVMVMAAGVNYNGVWASLGLPISPFDVHKAEYHIAGSDASGSGRRTPLRSIWFTAPVVWCDSRGGGAVRPASFKAWRGPAAGSAHHSFVQRA